MVPDGRKLLRKRTTTIPGSIPIPLQVSLAENTENGNAVLPTKGWFSISSGNHAQEIVKTPTIKVSMKDKAKKRLSKRRTDL